MTPIEGRELHGTMRTVRLSIIEFPGGGKVGNGIVGVCGFRGLFWGKLCDGGLQHSVTLNP